MADLGGDRVQGRCRYRGRGQVLSVAIALDDLRRGLGRAKSQPRAHELLDPWVQLRVGTDRAADRSDRYGVPRSAETLAVAIQLERPDRELVAEAGGFGVDPVTPSDDHRVAVLEAQPLHDRQQDLQPT